MLDLLGRRVTTLHDGPLPAGTHTLTWQADGIPSGVYLVRVEAGGTVETRRVTLVR